jgi:hypothetical protein
VKLVNLNFLILDPTRITDVSPLVSLTNLKYLYLASCPISNYFPLSEAAFETWPATGERGGECPDLATAYRMFNDAFGTKCKELYDKPLAYFEQVVQERFGMSIDELYALPVGE